MYKHACVTHVCTCFVNTTVVCLKTRTSFILHKRVSLHIHMFCTSMFANNMCLLYTHVCTETLLLYKHICCTFVVHTFCCNADPKSFTPINRVHTANQLKIILGGVSKLPQTDLAQEHKIINDSTILRGGWGSQKRHTFD